MNGDRREKSYFEMSAFCQVRKRLFWLVVLCISSMAIGGIINSFEDVFVKLPILVSFIPMLMGTCGNSGSQVATIIIRDLATGQLEIKDFFKIVLKESIIALSIGVVLGVIRFLIVLLMGGEVLVGLVVTITLVIVIILSNIIGGVLPLMIKKLNKDPVLIASPVITCLLDCISIVGYFLIAKLILKI